MPYSFPRCAFTNYQTPNGAGEKRTLNNKRIRVNKIARGIHSFIVLKTFSKRQAQAETILAKEKKTTQDSGRHTVYHFMPKSYNSKTCLCQNFKFFMGLSKFTKAWSSSLTVFSFSFALALNTLAFARSHKVLFLFSSSLDRTSMHLITSCF